MICFTTFCSHSYIADSNSYMKSAYAEKNFKLLLEIFPLLKF